MLFFSILYTPAKFQASRFNNKNKIVLCTDDLVVLCTQTISVSNSHGYTVCILYTVVDIQFCVHMQSVYHSVLYIPCMVHRLYTIQCCIVPVYYTDYTCLPPVPVAKLFINSLPLCPATAFYALYVRDD